MKLFVIDGAKFPSMAHVPEEWEEYDEEDPGARLPTWMVHFDHEGKPKAWREGVCLVGYAAFAERWGAGLVDDLMEHIDAVLNKPREEGEEPSQ